MWCDVLSSAPERVLSSLVWYGVVVQCSAPSAVASNSQSVACSSQNYKCTKTPYLSIKDTLLTCSLLVPVTRKKGRRDKPRGSFMISHQFDSSNVNSTTAKALTSITTLRRSYCLCLSDSPSITRLLRSSAVVARALRTKAGYRGVSHGPPTNQHNNTNIIHRVVT